MLDEIKKEFFEHLHKIDKSKLSIYDLKVYVDILKVADEIDRANKPDKWMEMLMAIPSTMGTMPQYKPVDLKEVE